jgi:hypothetical protein
VRSEISWRRRHARWPPQHITHCQTRITAHGTTDFARPVRFTISPHVANHLAAPISFGVVRRCVSPAVVASLNTVRRSSRDADYKTQCRESERQAPRLSARHGSRDSSLMTLSAHSAPPDKKTHASWRSFGWQAMKNLSEGGPHNKLFSGTALFSWPSPNSKDSRDAQAGQYGREIAARAALTPEYPQKPDGGS